MLDIGWPELMVVAIVLIIVVGPKDLPGMLRTFGKTTGKLREMAGDFRKQFDDALKEADLDEVKSVMDSARKLNPASEIKKQLNPLNKIGQEIKSELDSATKPASSGSAKVMELPDNPTAADFARQAEPVKGPVEETAAPKKAAAAKTASRKPPAARKPATEKTSGTKAASAKKAAPLKNAATRKASTKTTRTTAAASSKNKAPAAKKAAPLKNAATRKAST